MKKIIKSALPLGILAVTATSASSAISILAGGSGSFDEGSAVPYDYTALSSFDASSASKIVVTISNEDGSGDGNIGGVTFNGTVMSLAVSK